MFKRGQDWSCWRSVCLLAQEIPTRQGMFCLLEEGEFESILQGWSRKIERIGEEMRKGIINISRIQSRRASSSTLPYLTTLPPQPWKSKKLSSALCYPTKCLADYDFENPQIKKKSKLFM